MTNDDRLLRDYTRLRVDGSEHVIEVADITWDGPHTPVMSWLEALRLPEDTSAAEVERARRQLLQRRKFFVVCKECAERNAKGHTSSGVCHRCLERNGVVF